MTAKVQQQFSGELLECIWQIENLGNCPQLSSFSYFLQLMVEDNNQIISTNGVKMLTALVNTRSSLLPTSFPLLFLFRKFKMHKTHSTNLNLLKLVETLLASNRAGDLMSAVLEGMNSPENKANIKYGCTISFIRVFCYLFE